MSTCNNPNGSENVSELQRTINNLKQYKDELIDLYDVNLGDDKKKEILDLLITVDNNLKSKTQLYNQDLNDINVDLKELQKKIEEQKHMKNVMKNRINTTSKKKNTLALHHTLYLALAIILLLIQICIFIFVENPKC